MSFGTILLVIIVVVGALAIMAYNSLVHLRQRCRQAFADIDVQTKQRHDLVPNLVETVKGYAAHEKGTLDEVVKARAAAIAAPAGTPQQAQAEQALSGALGRLIAISEAYPDLKANQNFLELQQQLGDIEGKIAAARRFYNGAVSEYNAGIQAFPSVLFASAFGFTPETFFDLGEERTAVAQAPSVKF
jgi:LemA protein